MLILDGVYVERSDGTLHFRWVKCAIKRRACLTDQNLAQLIGRYLERLCRYISRPAISEQRLSLTPNGNVRYQLKTLYKDGTTHVIFEPLDFMYRMYGMPRAQGEGETGGREAGLGHAQERPLPSWPHWCRSRE